MSSPVNPYANAQAESFMKTLKVEEVYMAGYETFVDVATRLPCFIEGSDFNGIQHINVCDSIQIGPNVYHWRH